MFKLLNEPGKLNFIIDIHVEYAQRLTGGIVAMHKLAYEIARRGHNAYVFCKPEYNHSNIIRIPGELIEENGFMDTYTWEYFEYPLDKTITVYPQIVGGNPYNTAHNVRWILYHTEKVREDTFGEKDMLVNFGKFKTYDHGVPNQKLTVLEYQLDKLYINNFGKRKGFCYIKHKHTPPGGDDLIRMLEATDLSDWKTRGAYDYLRDQLNQYEYMLTYDQKSFYTVAAGLCGCKSIILNPGPSYEFSPNANSERPDSNQKMTPTEYRLENPLQMYGVAYGWDDIRWANSTIDMVRPHIENLEELDQKTIDSFVRLWELKLL